MKLLRPHILAICIALALFIIPFFWLKPGQMDLGGDSSRLYFYNPLAYLQHYSLFAVSPSDFGMENIGFFSVPTVVLFTLLLRVFHSSTLLIDLIHGINFSTAFLSIYFIIRYFLEDARFKKSISFYSGISAGMLYIFFQPFLYGWDKVLITHNQFFLNPLVFLFLLQYMRTSKNRYLLTTLVITFIFSPNFSFAAAPPVFAFYPLSILFLCFYRIAILKKKLGWRQLLIAFIAFLFLELFHILPQIVSMFSPNSVLNTTIFSSQGKFDRGLSYFVSIAPSIKLSLNLLGLPQMIALGPLAFVGIIFPLVVILGAFYNKNKTFLLTSGFFLIILFFVSATITQTGFSVYKALFSVPGFSMFRNFYGQWQYVFLFYYAILFGLALANIFSALPKIPRKLVSVIFVIGLSISALPLISGSLVNKELWQSKNEHIFMQPEKSFTEAISFVSQLSNDGKVLTLPLSDPGYQNIAGRGGMYQGPSTVAYLAGKQDYAGLDEFGDFKDAFATAVKTKDIEKIKEILGDLNIKYIFYDADPRVYDNFPIFPYENVHKFFPITQGGYKKFISLLPLKELKSFNKTYYVYKIENNLYRPRIFATDSVSHFTNQISDWSVPISFTSQKYSVYTTNAPITSAANTYQSVDAISPIFEMLKNPDVPLPIQHAFAKTSPLSPTYPIIMAKENFSFRKSIKNPDVYIDQKMFFAAKRLDELEEWRDDMSFLKSEKNQSSLLSWFSQAVRKPIWDEEWWQTYSSIQGILARYTLAVDDAIREVNITNQSDCWKLQKKFLISEYLVDHRKRFTNLIAGFRRSDKKPYVDMLVDEIFQHFTDELQFPVISPTDIEYGIADPVEAGDTLFVEKSAYDNAITNGVTFEQDGKDMFPDGSQLEVNWESLDISPTQGGAVFHLVEHNPVNVFDTAALLSITKPSQSQIDWRNGLVWKLTQWIPNSFYFVSFDYSTGGTPYAFKLYEQEKGNKQTQINQILTNQLKSRKWMHYQALVKSGSNSLTAYIQIVGDDTVTPIEKLQLKNLQLTYVPAPQMYVVKHSQSTSTPPVISYIQINPTKYEIHVTNASDPYYLVLNEAFNSRWKLFLSNSNTSGNQNFLSPAFYANMFRKPLVVEQVPVNGFANAWYITPKDIHNKQSYTIIAEMTTQWDFYIGMFISLITLFSILIFALFCTFSKKYYEKIF